MAVEWYVTHNDREGRRAEFFAAVSDDYAARMSCSCFLPSIPDREWGNDKQAGDWHLVAGDRIDQANERLRHTTVYLRSARAA